MTMQPLLLLDFDDCICLSKPYGGYDVALRPWPEDLPTKLWHQPAIEVLRSVVEDFEPQVVVTSSWLGLMMLDSIKDLFEKTGVPWLANALHPHGEALQNRGWTRLQAIDAWLMAHHRGEPYAIVDDPYSGTGLAQSRHDKSGRLVLCDVNVGLKPVHALQIRKALSA